MNVNQYISNSIPSLLHEHHFLVVPEFGAFILNYKSAIVKKTQGVIFPPGYWVSFNSNIQQNDGQFATYLAKELNIALSDANSHLQGFASYCKAVLANRARITIDGVGFFYYDFENNLCFEPNLNDQFNKENFGLTSIKLEEITEEEPVKLNFDAKDKTLISLSESKHQPLITSARKWRKYAFAAVITAISLTMLSIAILNNPTKGGMLASMFNSGSVSQYSPVQYSDIQLVSSNQGGKDLVFNSNGISELNVNGIELSVVDDKAFINKSSGVVKHKIFEGQFQIVVGCFSQVSNAKKLVKQYTQQGVQVYLSGLNSKGMHVVSYGSYTTKEEALTELASIKSNFPNAWVKTQD
ncbi:MAG: SPOR domain-containing protein [Bacteroidetes bacterium]|nr:SPOR domain-containing protein [Bacteroidota bacterium]